jgi:hypothetical protein
MQWPILNFRNIEANQNRKKAEELTNCSQLQSKCRGFTSITDYRNGNAWLYNPNLLKPISFLIALKLRVGKTSDKVTMNKETPQSTPPSPQPPEQRVPQHEQRNLRYQTQVQHERKLVEYLMRVRLKEIQNDNYDQHKRSLQNQAQNLCKREQQHLLHQISRV